MPPALSTILILIAAAAAGATPPAGEPPRAGVEAKLLGAPADARLELALDPAIAASWAEANVGLAVLRDTGGQRALLPAVRPKAARLALPAAAAFEEGCGVVVAELGPPLAATPAQAAPPPDAWRRVTRVVKLYLCRPTDDPAAALAERRALSSIATAKAGTLVEIRPLANPLALRPGSDLPVRLYAEQAALAGATVTAHAPDGTVTSARADANGIATLRLATAGRWLLRLEATTDDVARTAEVVFDLLPSAELERAGESS